MGRWWGKARIRYDAYEGGGGGREGSGGMGWRGGGGEGAAGCRLKRRAWSGEAGRPCLRVDHGGRWWRAGALLQGVEALDDFLHEGLVGGPLRHHFLQLGRQILKQEVDVITASLVLEIVPHRRWL